MDLSKERRAFEMLQWNPYSLPTEFNAELALLGHYSKLQRERSDNAFDRIEREFQQEQERRKAKGHRTELEAFHELIRQGVLNETLDLFSPVKAGDGFYSSLLKNHAELTDARSERRKALSEPGPLRPANRKRLSANTISGHHSGGSAANPQRAQSTKTGGPGPRRRWHP